MPSAIKTKPDQPIRLHTTLLSGHGHRVKLFLTLLDLPFTTIELNMKAGDNRKPAHLALNPFGEVPVIEDGDIVLTDSNAILVYLAQKYGDASWLLIRSLPVPQPFNAGCRSLRAILCMDPVPRVSSPCSAHRAIKRGRCALQKISSRLSARVW